MSEIKFPELTPQVRDMIMRVIDEVPQNMMICFMLVQQRPRQLLPMFEWLVRNGVTGKRFHDWFVIEHENSPLLALTELTKRIEKEKQHRHLFAGRDLI